MTLTPEVVDEPWVLCTGCSILVYSKRLVRNLLVCPECNQHKRVPAPQRVQQLVDAGSWVPLRARVHPGDPLEFTDSRPYPERLTEARRRTGLDDAVLCGTGRIDGHPVALAVMDFRFLGGSLGSGAGELVTRTAEVALDRRLPLVLVTASGGARMQEGVLALMQMAKVSQAIGRLQEAGLLSVSLVTDPTYGGVAASFATNTDIVIAESGARMGFAGPRVIEQTIGQRLPAGFQTADFLLTHGQVDMVVARHALRSQLSRLLAVAGADRAAASVHNDEPGDEPVRTTLTGDGPPADAWDTVRLARHPDRPTTTDYLHRILDVFVELHGDRLRADCPAIVAGLGRIGGRPVAVIGHQKGHTTKDLVHRNFGMALPEGYRKAQRIMQLAARLGLPVLTLIDTPGAYPGLDAEENGQAQAIAQTILQMSALPVPVVSVLTGEGGSGGALALAVGDRVFAAENAVYSVISPEGCSSILWNTPTSAAEAARALQLTAPELLRMEIVDGVVPEPAGGAHIDPAGMADRVRWAVLATLPELLALPADVLVERRRARFRRFGAGVAWTAGTGPDGGATR